MSDRIKVYDAKTGEAISLNAIDARERVRAGLATTEPPAESKPEAGEKELTVDEMKEALTAAGVEFRANASEASLRELLEKSGK